MGRGVGIGILVRRSVLRPHVAHAGAGRFVQRHSRVDTRSDRRAHVLGVISGATLLTLLFSTPVFLTPTHVQHYYLALLLTVLTVMPMAVRLRTREFDLFEPIVPVSLLIGLAFGIRAMYLAYSPVSILPVHVGRFPFDDFVGSALTLTIGAYCALLVGYYVLAAAIPVTPAWKTWQQRTWPTELSRPKLAGLLILGAVGTALTRFTSPDEMTSATNAINLLAGCVQVSGCILALHIAGGDHRRWLRIALWCVVIPLAVWQSVVLVAKTPTLLMAYGVMAAFHYARRPIRLGVLAPAVVFLIVVVFPTVSAYRAADESPLGLSSSDFSTSEVVARAAAIPARLTRYSALEYLQLSAESVIGRFNGIDSLALLLKYDVSDELSDPSLYPLIPVYAFIPRFIWSDKPVLERGTRFGQLLIEPSTTDGVAWESSYGMFHLGDLLVNFGYLGVLIGSALLGCLYRLAYRFLDPSHAGDLGVKFIYIFVLWSMVNGFEADIPSIYANLMKALLIWVVVKVSFNARLLPIGVRSAAEARWTRLARTRLGSAPGGIA